MKHRTIAASRRGRPVSGLRTSCFALCLLAMGAWSWTAQAEIPPRPPDRHFFHDLAQVVEQAPATKIQLIQQEIFDQCGVPIVVVTVPRMADYDPGSPSIESFARRWFDSWGIGSQANNSGMLVILSRDDRKARIELGADWGGRFDQFCRQLMDKKMVPQFKKGHYGEGLLAAVASLGAIAKAGPQADPPAPALTERILENPLMKFNRESNPIAKKAGPWAIILMLVAGLTCLVAAMFFPEHRKALVIAGLVLIGLALLFWIVVIIFGILNRSRSGDGSYGGGGGWSGGGGGGGGFGGGSSGGGGASGSW